LFILSGFGSSTVFVGSDSAVSIAVRSDSKLPTVVRNAEDVKGVR